MKKWLLFFFIVTFNFQPSTFNRLYAQVSETTSYLRLDQSHSGQVPADGVTPCTVVVWVATETSVPLQGLQVTVYTSRGPPYDTIFYPYGQITNANGVCTATIVSSYLGGDTVTANCEGVTITENIVNNPSFELGSGTPTSWWWNNNVLWKISTDTYVSGLQSITNSCTIAGDSYTIATWTGTKYADRWPITETTSFFASQYCKTDNLTVNTARIRIIWFRDSSVITEVNPSTLSGTNPWTLMSATVTSPATANGLMYRCQQSGAGTAWFDTVRLRRVPTLNWTASKLKFTTSAFSVTINNPSSTIIVEVQDGFGTCDASFNNTVNLSTSSPVGKFSVDKFNWQDTSIITLSSGKATFYYKDSNTGNPVITVSRALLNADSQTETILTQGVNETASYITFTPYQVYADSITVCNVVITINDTYGFPIVNKLTTLQTTHGNSDTIQDSIGGTVNPQTTDSSGQCTFTIKSLYAGWDTLTAKCDGTTVTRGVNKYGAVGIWHFDTDTKDVSGYANNGTIYGALWTSAPDSAAFGSALQFDGIDDYVKVLHSSSISPAQAMSLEAWIKFNSFGAYSAVSKTQAGGYAFQDYSGDGAMEFVVNVGGSYYRPEIAESQIGTGTWRHFVGTYDGNYARIYMDGTLMDTKSASGTIQGNSADLFFGAESGGASPEAGKYFNGIIDEARIYDRALSDTEIKASYNKKANIYFCVNILKFTTPARTTTVSNPSSYITIEVQDGSGNRETTFNNTVTLTSTSGNGKFSVDRISWSDTSAITLSAGFCVVYYKDSTVGAPTMTVSRSGCTSGTQTVTVLNQGVNETSSYITFTPYPILPDNTARCTAVVTINDTYGFPVAARLVTIATTRGDSDTINDSTGTGTSLTQTTDANGVCTWTIKSSYAGLDTITATCDGKTIMRGVNKYGTVLILHFDTDTKDVSDYANNGTIYGALWTSAPDSAAQGSALRFDGVDDYVQINNSTSLNITDAITVEAWIKSAGTNNNAGLVFAGDVGFDYGIWIQGGNFYGGIWNTTPTQITATATFGPTVGQWYHVVMKYDSNAGALVKLYVNGALASTTAGSGKIRTGHTTLLIGGKQPASWYFNGIIDEVKVYNRALSAEEISASYGSCVISFDDTPSPPANVKAETIIPELIKVSWTCDSPSVTMFKVFRSLSPGVVPDSTTLIGISTVPTTYWKDLNVGIGDTVYYYVVTAVSSGGESQKSSEVSAKPVQAPIVPGWYPGDLHCHSTYSDGTRPPAFVANRAKERGLNWLILTDHNAMDGKTEIEQQTDTNFLGIIGEEVSMGLTNHFNAHFINTLVGWTGFPQERINDTINQGGLAFINHPYFFTYRWVDWNVENYTGIEIWNGFAVAPGEGNGNDTTVLRWDQLLNQGYRYAAIGASDSHDPDANAYVGRLGTPRTYCYFQRLNRSELYNALKNGHCFVSDGPTLNFTVNGTMMGDTLSVSCGSPVSISINCTASATTATLADIELVKNGYVWQSWSGGSYNFSQSLQDNPTYDCFYRIRIKDNLGKIGFSNPVYIKVTNIPYAGVGLISFNYYIAQAQDIDTGEVYRYLQNDTAKLVITNREEFNNNDIWSSLDNLTGTPGTPVDFVLMDGNNYESTDWTMLALNSTMDSSDYRHKNKYLYLDNITGDTEKITCEGFYQLNPEIKAKATYKMLSDTAPIVKINVLLSNTGATDYNGYLFYQADYENGATVYIPGIGWNPVSSVIYSGWTDNFIYGGDTSTVLTQSGLAWNEDIPAGIYHYGGNTFGVWFNASIPAGSSTVITFYQIVDYRDLINHYGNIEKWAYQINNLDRKLRFITPVRTTTVDSSSDSISAEVYSSSGRDTTYMDSCTFVSSSSAGRFSLDKNTWNDNNYFTTNISSGVASVYYKDTKAGSFTISVYTDDLGDTFQSVSITPGTISETTSYLRVSSPIVQANGVSPCTVSIYIKDEYGNAIQNKQVTIFTSRGLSFTSVTQPGLTDNNGQCTGVIFSSVTGGDTVFVLCDGETIIENIINNPSFEEGNANPNNWAFDNPAGGQWTWVSDTVYLGVRAIQNTSTVAADRFTEARWTGTPFVDRYPIASNSKYICTQYTKTNLSSGSSVIRLIWWDSATYLGEAAYSGVSGTTDWALQSYTWTSPSNANQLTYRCHNNGVGTAWFDAVRLRRIPTINWTTTNLKFTTPARTTTASNPSSYITIEVQDGSGNRETTFNNTVTLTSTSGNGKFSVDRITWQDTTIITLSQGSAIVYYKDSNTGNPIITAYRESLAADTQVETIFAQGVNETASYITFTPYQILADGTSVCSVVITINDTYGFPIVNKLTTLQTTNGNSDTINDSIGGTVNPQTTDSSGQCTFTIKSLYAGWDTITATCDGKTIARGINKYGAVGIWHFDTDTKDVSGQGNNAALPDTFSQRPLWISASDSAAQGSALKFDGVDDYVEISDHDSLDLTNAFTFEAWVYPTAINTGFQEEWGTIFGKNFYYGSYWLALNDGLGVTIYLNGGGWTYISAATSISLNQWNHVAATYDGTTVRIYTNGTLYYSPAGPASITPNAQNLRIGVADSIYHFKGYISEAKIYNRALNTDEVKASYEGRVNIFFTQWEFSETSSYFLFGPSRVPADSVSSCTVVVSILGSDGNPISGKGVTLSTTRSNSDTIIPSNLQTTDVNGKCTWTIASNYAGQDTITVLSDGKNVSTGISTQGLCGLWHLDNDLKDASGNTNTGELNGPVYTTGKFGYGLWFDGINDYVRFANNPTLDITKEITVEAWFKADTITGSHSIVDKGRDWWGSGWRIYLNESYIYFSANTDTADNQNEIFLSYPFNDTTNWNYVAATYGKDGARLYLNGVLVNSAQYAGPIVYKYNEDLAIGCMGYDIGNFFRFNGSIDEVHIYNRVLTADEIRTYYEGKAAFYFSGCKFKFSTSPFKTKAGVSSVPISIFLADNTNNLDPSFSDTAMITSSSDSRSFSTDAANWSSDGADTYVWFTGGQGTFYYKDGKMGTPFITVSRSDLGLQPAVQQETITGSVLRVVSPVFVISTAQRSETIVVVAQDGAGNTDTNWNETIGFTSTSNKGKFSLSATPWADVTSTGFVNGVARVFYKDSRGGVPTLTFTSGDISTNQTETVLMPVVVIGKFHKNERTGTDTTSLPVLIVSGDTLLYVIKISNSGAETSTDVIITDTLTFDTSIYAPLYFISMDTVPYADSWTYAVLSGWQSWGGVPSPNAADVKGLRWKINTLRPGEEKQVKFRVKVK